MSSQPPPGDNPTPPRPFTPAETRRALRSSMVAWGLFGSAWMAMTGGAPYVTFVRERLHISTVLFGVLSALPYLGVLAQLPGSLWAERARVRRPIVYRLLTVGRGTWLLIAVLPWVVPAAFGGLRILAFMALVLSASLLSNVVQPAGFSWFADIVPEHLRARYLSRRAALSTFTVVVVSFVVSRLVESNTSFLFYTCLFGIAGLLGVADVVYYCSRTREAPMSPQEETPRSILTTVGTPLRDRTFRGYLLYAFSESFMNGIVGPFWWLMALEYLKTGPFWANAYVMAVPMVFVAIALPMWGGVCDRFGAKTLLRVGAAVQLIYPLLWSVARPGHFHAWLAVPSVIGGLFGAAVMTADMTMMYELTPKVNRSAYTAVLMLCSNLGYAVSPVLGGVIAQALKPLSLHVAGLTFVNYHFLLAVSVVVTLLHLFVVVPHLPSTGHLPTRDLVRHVVRRPLEKLSDTLGRKGEESKRRDGEES